LRAAGGDILSGGFLRYARGFPPRLFMLPALILTYFGNVAVLIPLCALLTVWIVAHVSRRAAVLWVACVCGVVAMTAFAKMLFAGCNYDVSHIHSLSGHTSFSVISYGGVAVVLSAGLQPWQRWAIALLYVCWVVGIGITRVLLHAHTPEEVVAGWVLGGAGAAIFLSLYRATERPKAAVVAAAAAVLVVIALLPPAHFSFESLLRWLGRWLVRRVPVCI
jgi:membrane-associated phospholipid phosphatase